MPPSERRLDSRLPLAEPIERCIDFSLVELAQAEHAAQACARRRRIKLAPPSIHVENLEQLG